MLVTITKREDVPTGRYVGGYLGSQEKPTVHGKRALLRFKVAEGQYTGREVTMFCKVSEGELTPKHKLVQAFAKLQGCDVKDGQSLSDEDCIGRKYVIEVRKADNGRSQVDAIVSCVSDDECPF